MISDTPKEEDDYWSLLESTQRQQHPDFIEYLSDQEGAMREEGQAVVIEFQDSSKSSVRKLRTSTALRNCLNEKDPKGAVYRRAFVLESLPRNLLQVLGAKLRVPPAFFASHWAGLGSIIGNVLNRTPRHYDATNQSVRRRLSRVTIFGDLDGSLSSYKHLSFWSKCSGESWDAILLVDPPLGDFTVWEGSSTPREVCRDDSIKLVDLNMPGLDQRGSWYPSCDTTDIRGPISADWTNVEKSPGMKSMFEDILLLYKLKEQQRTADPNGCIDVCKRIVLSAWTAYLHIAEAYIIKEQYQMSIIDPTIVINTANPFEKSWARPWDPRDFGRQVRAKSALELTDWELYRNMDALGVYSNTESTEKWEAEAWRSLHNVVQNLKARLDIISQAYMQAASVRESITSNKQAQQVGYLTSLATIFLPISFVVAIFSVGGDFSAGAKCFWVYWVIAVPVVTI